jgi:enoyl-CoA hydratase/carnithine racemase
MIEVARDGAVLTLHLNRPPANALTRKMLESLRRELDTAARDKDVRCVYIASRLPKYFSSGLELADVFAPPLDDRSGVFLELLDTHRQLARLGKPTIAALSGYAMLGGWILAMACDFRWLAAETGRVALSEIRFGLTPTEFLLRRLRAMGADMALTKDLVLKGRTLKAPEALAGRFVDRLIPAKELEQATLSEAHKLARLAPEAFASIKKSLADSADAESEDLWQRSRAEFTRLLAGDEAREGLAAMQEKRRARWE